MQASKYKLTSDITEMNSDMKKIDSGMNEINTTFTQMMNHKQHYFPDKKDSPKAHDPNRGSGPNFATFSNPVYCYFFVM